MNWRLSRALNIQLAALLFTFMSPMPSQKLLAEASSAAVIVQRRGA